MFTRVNAKQEQFLWLLVDGQPQERAYAMVYGPAKSREVCAANASRMLTNANVQARKAEIIAQRHAARPISVERLSADLLAIASESRALGQGSAAVAAVMGAAKLNGLIVDKVQQDVLVRKPSASPESPDEMSAEQWLGMVSGSLPTPLTIEHNQNEHEEIKPSDEGS